ncbi:copper resistance protein CopC [Sphaerisporangium album]|uniref:Copper resistance protein CopC n=1 Tax=Sphaerisporangium album TaxID=509200 RepID=A0A367FCV6_9ACTN|nr:copper resistance CopC family protein [Sphaerisporangium album]RCG28198.1 copper resistance protein CopC [Sphaerisporangium album]
MRTSPLAALLAFVAAVVLGTAVASPALAHTALKSSDPKKGATVETLDKVTLTFTESVKFPVVLVRDAEGRDHKDGKPKTDGPTVTQKVAGTLPSGKYTIAWRVVSEDGHPIEGEIPFTVKAPAASTPSPTPTPPAASPSPTESPIAVAPTPPPFTPTPVAEQGDAGSGGIPAWVWIAVFGVAGIGIGTMISLRKKP